MPTLPFASPSAACPFGAWARRCCALPLPFLPPFGAATVTTVDASAQAPGCETRRSDETIGAAWIFFATSSAIRLTPHRA
jgi:hypothetical protein